MQLGRPLSKPRTYDGDSSLTEYLQHFDLCAVINGWTEAQAGAFLGVSLAGNARRLLEGLNTCTATGYAELRQRLRDRYEPENATGVHKAKLRSIEREETQTLGAFADEVLALVRKAYPTVPHETQEVLAKDRFIEALPDAELRLWIYAAQPSSLKSAVSVGIEGEACLAKEKGRKARVRTVAGGDVALWEEKLDRLATRVEEMAQRASGAEGRTKQNNKRRGKIICWRCQEPGHMARDCTAPAPARRPVEPETSEGEQEN